MIFAQLSTILCLPQDTSNSAAFTTSLLSHALLSEHVVPYVSLLDYIANVLLSDFLALYWILFLSAPSARSCQLVHEGLLQLLTTLLAVLRKPFLLVFQPDSFTPALSSATTHFSTIEIIIQVIHGRPNIF